MSNATKNSPETTHDKMPSELITTFEKMVEVQEKSLELKAKELDIEQENIRSNEVIALATIEAQKSDRQQQMQSITKLQTQKHYIIGGIIVAIVAIIIVAMLTNNITFAVEFLKIGGAVLMGYVAGLGHSRLNATKNNPQSNE